MSQRVQGGHGKFNWKLAQRVWKAPMFSASKRRELSLPKSHLALADAEALLSLDTLESCSLKQWASVAWVESDVFSRARALGASLRRLDLDSCENLSCLELSGG